MVNVSRQTIVEPKVYSKPSGAFMWQPSRWKGRPKGWNETTRERETAYQERGWQEAKMREMREWKTIEKGICSIMDVTFHKQNVIECERA